MTRLRGVLLLAVILLFVVRIVPAAEVLTNDTIVTMVKAGLGEELIVSKIKISQNQFDLSTSSILRMKTEGVSEKIITAMIEASAPPAPPQPKSDQAVAQETQDAVALYRQGKVAEAVAALDKLLAEKPNDDGLKIWKALALLKQARGMRYSKVSGYKPVVLNAWAILKSLQQRQAANPDWNFAVAMAFWLNDRPTWAKRAADKALDLRADFAEAHLLLGDMAYEEAMESRPGPVTVPNQKWWMGVESRKAYEAALALTDLPPDLRAEAFYKIGIVSAELEKKRDVAREYWEKAVAADPDSRYGRMAQEKLKTVSAK